MAKKKNSRKPGRPKGSKNKECKTVRVVPVRCWRCKSTNLKAVRKVIERNISGTDEGGELYNKIVHRVSACEDCGAHTRQIVREYHPQKD